MEVSGLSKGVNVEIKAYFSHSIRGASGNNATKEELRINCERAKCTAEYLRDNMKTSVFKLDLYVPAEHDEFAQSALNTGRLKIEDILYLDCKILDGRDILILDGSMEDMSGGMEEEYSYAQESSVPTIFMNDYTHADLCELIRMCLDVIERKNDE